MVLWRCSRLQDITAVKRRSKLGCDPSFNLSDLVLGGLNTCLVHYHFWSWYISAMGSGFQELILLVKILEIISYFYVHFSSSFFFLITLPACRCKWSSKCWWKTSSTIILPTFKDQVTFKCC